MSLTESQTRYVNFYTDFAFKKLFGTEANKDLLLSFLNSRFEGQEKFLDIQYLNSEHLGDLEERPAELKEAIFTRLFEQAEIAQYSPEERQDYEESLKNFRDWYSALKTAEKKGHKEGRAEGRAEGLEEGLEEGEKKGVFKTAKNLLALGLPLETIIQATGLSEDEIKRL